MCTHDIVSNSMFFLLFDWWDVPIACIVFVYLWGVFFGGVAFVWCGVLCFCPKFDFALCLCCLVVLGSGLSGSLCVSLGRALWVVFRVVGVFLFVCFVVGCVFAGSFGFFLRCVVLYSAFRL